MNKNTLERNLNSIGKTCYVKYFQDFLDYQFSRLKKQDLITKLAQNEGYSQTGSRVRIFCAKNIIEAGRAIEALRIVASSGRISAETSLMASRLIAIHSKYLG